MTTIPCYTTVPAPPMRNAKCSRAVAIMQLIFGSLLFLLEIIGLGIGNYSIDLMSVTGTGIWNGIFFVITGTLGVLATRPHTGLPTSRRGLTTAFMVMSILSSILAGGMIIFSAFSMIIATGLNYSYSHPYNYGYGSSSSYSYYRYINFGAFLGVRITSLLLYIAQFVCFIVSASLRCCNVCCGEAEGMVAQQVTYHAAPYPGQQSPLYYGGGPQMVSTVMQPPNGGQFIGTNGQPQMAMQGALPGYSYVLPAMPQLTTTESEKASAGV